MAEPSATDKVLWYLRIVRGYIANHTRISIIDYSSCPVLLTRQLAPTNDLPFERYTHTAAAGKHFDRRLSGRRH